MLKKFNDYINENVYKDEFKILYDKSPEKLKGLIEQTKNIKQDKVWHPEGDVYKHIRLVTNRLANCYNDIDLTLSGFFHDLGKIDKTKFDKDKQSYTSYEHELSSYDILYQFKDWIENMGGNFDKIQYIVLNHMRYKFLSDMRINEQIKFMNEPYFSDLEKFSTADYGGIDLNCKSIPDNKEIMNKINNYLKIKEENKVISSKFNGNIIMNKYPNLKGKRLGDVINGFKNTYDDFRKYALNASSQQIMSDFDSFIINNNININ